MKTLWLSAALGFALLATIQAQCDPAFVLAKHYASNMVLQRAPARPKFWGYASAVGQDVIVHVDGAQTLITTTFAGPEGRPIWEATLQPIQTEGPHSILFQLSGTACTIIIDNVLMGDVYICSGQSNMEHRLDNIDNPQPDVDDVVNYPKIRSVIVQHDTATSPQQDLLRAPRQWALPTPANMASFSAVCWLFGRNLFRKYGRPIGLIETNWGGTRIEAWSSTAALDVCYSSGAVPPAEGANAATVLYNAMIHPLLSMPIFGAIWYQGESNSGYTTYACMVKSMVSDWRQRWFTRNPEMDATFSFGQVQLAPNGNNDNVGGFPDVRWHQTDSLGYAPNANMDKIYVAVAADLPDFNSPYGAIHPRYKRQIADRLALAAFQVAYGTTDNGIYQGPLPTQLSLEGSSVRVSYGIPLQYGDTSRIFELCCGATEANICTGGGGAWVVTSLTEQGSDNVALSNPCSAGQVVTGFRYLWRESPCPTLEACPIYSVENNLPAPPYRYEGAIVAGRPVVLKH